MQSQGPKAESLLPHQPLAPVLERTPALWICLELDTALKSEALLPTKKRSAARTTTCAYIVLPLGIGLRDSPINNQGESPPLPLLPPLREVCLFPLFLFCPLLLLPRPKSSMRQKTNFHCK